MQCCIVCVLPKGVAPGERVLSQVNNCDCVCLSEQSSYCMYLLVLLVPYRRQRWGGIVRESLVHD